MVLHFSLNIYVRQEGHDINKFKYVVFYIRVNTPNKTNYKKQSNKYLNKHIICIKRWSKYIHECLSKMKLIMFI